ILQDIIITSGMLIYNCRQSFDSEKMLKLYFDYLVKFLPRISDVYGLNRALLMSCSLLINAPNSSLFIQSWSVIADFLQGVLSKGKTTGLLDDNTGPLAIELTAQILA